MISEGSHGAQFDNVEPGGINYVEDPNKDWTWVLPLVLSAASIVGLGGWWICG